MIARKGIRLEDFTLNPVRSVILLLQVVFVGNLWRLQQNFTEPPTVSQSVSLGSQFAFACYIGREFTQLANEQKIEYAKVNF